METRHIKRTFGAEIEGLVLRRAGEAELAELRDILVGAGLVVLRRQSLTDEELIRAAAGLSTAKAAATTTDDIAYISDLTDETGRSLGEADYAGRDWGGESDPEPDQRFRLLYAIETPATGGEFHFCDLQQALTALSPKTRKAAEAARIERKPPGLLGRMFGAGQGRAPAPMIFDGPDGGKRLRLPGEGDWIEGIEPDAAMTLVDELSKELIAEAHCAVHEWGAGDVLIWDRDRFLRRREPSTGVYLMKSLCFT